MCPQRHQCLHTATIEQLEGLVKLSGRSCLACTIVKQRLLRFGSST